MTPPPPPPALSRAADVLFAESVEAWVGSASGPRRFDALLPPDLADAVRSLGCEHHRCRELATAAVLAHPLAPRGAYWASRAADPEVAARGRWVRRRLLACPHCSAAGVCPARPPYESYRPCPVCDAVPYDPEVHGGGTCRLCAGAGDFAGEPTR